MSHRQLYAATAILVLATFILNTWAWSSMASSKLRSDGAASDMVRCRRLADDVLRLKDRPAIAGSHEIELTELSRRIERAAADAGIPAPCVIRIAPEPGRRPEDGPGAPDAAMADGTAGGTGPEAPYIERPTTVSLADVTLAQLVRFLYCAGEGEAAMDVRSLRLSAPREREAGDRWDAEITLSYLIYAPPETQGIHGLRAAGERAGT